MAEHKYIGEDLNPGAMEVLSGIPEGQPVAIINLIKYKEWADYPSGTVSDRLTGKDAYNRYSELSLPFLNKVGGVPVWRGDFAANLIGPEDESWDEIIIVQYPDRSAFQQMMVDKGYLNIVFHRTAAVKDSRLYCSTSPQSIGAFKWKIFNLAKKLGIDV